MVKVMHDMDGDRQAWRARPCILASLLDIYLQTAISVLISDEVGSKSLTRSFAVHSNTINTTFGQQIALDRIGARGDLRHASTNTTAFNTAVNSPANSSSANSRCSLSLLGILRQHALQETESALLKLERFPKMQMMQNRFAEFSRLTTNLNETKRPADPDEDLQVLYSHCAS